MQIDLVRETPPGAVVTGEDDSARRRLHPHRGVRPGVADRVKAQADELAKSGATSLIVDVRHTAEGPFESGLDAARMFVPVRNAGDQGGTRREDRSRETVPRPRRATAAVKLPVTLLVTTGTSGAAELFAAALDGNKRADLIGERTLGRAGIQKLVRLPDGRGLWLTYARYLTPTGEVIQGKGLSPDMEVDEPDADFGEAPPAKDPILDAALDRISQERPPSDCRI